MSSRPACRPIGPAYRHTVHPDNWGDLNALVRAARADPECFEHRGQLYRVVVDEADALRDPRTVTILTDDNQRLHIRPIDILPPTPPTPRTPDAKRSKQAEAAERRLGLHRSFGKRRRT